MTKSKVESRFEAHGRYQRWEKNENIYIKIKKKIRFKRERKREYDHDRINVCPHACLNYRQTCTAYSFILTSGKFNSANI